MDFEREKSSREDDLDSFWDIESLLPKKKKTVYSSPMPDTSTTEIEIPQRGAGESRNASKAQAIPLPTPRTDPQPTRRFIPPHTEAEERAKPEPILEYTPENTLIRSVRIYRPQGNYQYYEAFLRDAIRLYPIHGEECPRVTFFSYVPQYSQLDRAQLEWYLWWRECVRNGEYLNTDYAYVLLYLYELINLSARLDPKTVQTAMINVWEHYRDIYHQLDAYLSEWVCDHALLYQLSVPANMPQKLLSIAMTRCNFKEFYFSPDPTGRYAGALIAFCNNYDYKKSKFYAANAALFDRCMPTVLNSIVDHMSGEGKLFGATRMDDSRMMRSAFTGALCACSIKRNIELEYCSFSRSNELRYLITDVIKYTENLLRAHLGIRSRLSIYSLPNGIRESIDACVSPLLPPKPLQARTKKEEPVAEYEKLYDLPSRPLSLSHAAEIEKNSWNTTERLIEAFEEETTDVSIEKEPVAIPVPAPAEAHEEQESGLSSMLLPYAAFLRAVMEEDRNAQKIRADSLGMLPDAVADAINEIAAEQTGDILIEEDGEGCYLAIPDYTDLIEEVLNGIE